jgi:hypothetical protein
MTRALLVGFLILTPLPRDPRLPTDRLRAWERQAVYGTKRSHAYYAHHATLDSPPKTRYLHAVFLYEDTLLNDGHGDYYDRQVWVAYGRDKDEAVLNALNRFETYTGEPGALPRSRR